MRSHVGLESIPGCASVAELQDTFPPPIVECLLQPYSLNARGRARVAIIWPGRGIRQDKAKLMSNSCNWQGHADV